MLTPTGKPHHAFLRGQFTLLPHQPCCERDARTSLLILSLVRLMIWGDGIEESLCVNCTSWNPDCTSVYNAHLVNADQPYSMPFPPSKPLFLGGLSVTLAHLTPPRLRKCIEAALIFQAHQLHTASLHPGARSAISKLATTHPSSSFQAQSSMSQFQASISIVQVRTRSGEK